MCVFIEVKNFVLLCHDGNCKQEHSNTKVEIKDKNMLQ